MKQCYVLLPKHNHESLSKAVHASVTTLGEYINRVCAFYYYEENYNFSIHKQIKEENCVPSHRLESRY